MEKLSVKDTSVLVTQQSISLEDTNGGIVEVLPAEVEELREFIGTIWKMTSLPALPSNLESRFATFACTVSPNTTTVSKTGNLTAVPGFTFNLNDCSFVIDALDLGMAKIRDMYSLDPLPRSEGASDYRSRNFDVFEGHE